MSFPSPWKGVGFFKWVLALFLSLGVVMVSVCNAPSRLSVIDSVIQGFFPLSVLSSVSVLVLKVLPSVRSVLLSVGSFGIEELRVFLAHSVIHQFGFEIREVVHL